MAKRRSKYNNRKIKRNGMVFDSLHEYDRWRELLLLEKKGEISHLQRQVKYVLIPKQYSNTEFTKKGKPMVVEREASYVADFVYHDLASNEVIVEDAKGYRTDDYILKRKLMLHVHGIQVREV